MTDEVISIAECSRRLKEAGDDVGKQGLTKYIKHHNLPKYPMLTKAGKPGKRQGVKFEEIKSAREDYTREKMRGELSGAKEKKTEKPASPDEDIRAAAIAAKTRKEEASARSSELDLYERTKDVLATAEVEIMIGLAMTLLKEQLLGVNLTDDADVICSTNNLPDTARQPIRQTLKNRRTKILNRISDTFTAELARLDPDHSAGLSARLDLIANEIQKMREEEFENLTRAA